MTLETRGMFRISTSEGYVGLIRSRPYNSGIESLKKFKEQFQSQPSTLSHSDYRVTVEAELIISRRLCQHWQVGFNPANTSISSRSSGVTARRLLSTIAGH